MCKSYLSSVKNTVLSSKLSTSIRLLLFVLLVFSKKINPSNLYFKFLITLFFLIGFGFNGLNAQCVRPDTPSPSSPLGSDTPCEGSTVTYSITSSTNATSYSWFYPSDWVVLSGETTNAITFKVGQSSGNIGVFGVNCSIKSYSSSQRYIQIIRKPTTPGQPTSYNASCNGFTAQWTTDGTQVNYLVDVSTDPNFSSFVAVYQGYNAGNVQSIVLTGLVSSTTYYYRIRRSSSCGISDDYSPSNSVTTSGGGGAGGTVTGAAAVCSGNNSGLLTLSGQTGTVQKWQSAVSPYIIWSDISNTGKTYTSGALYSTTKFRAVVLNGNCATYSVSKTITVNPSPSAPIVGTTTQPTCSKATGSAVLSDLPATGTINQTGTVVTNFPITGTSMTISGLAVGTYQFAITNTSGCKSTVSANVVINASKIAKWNGSAWTNGPPTASQALEFSGDYSSSGDLTACSCKVTGSKKVIINAGHTLTITNEVKIVATGTLIFEDTASLVQINDVLNSGNIIYKRYVNIRNTDYTYWSSPVAGYTLGGVSKNKTLSDKYYSYNSTKDNWQQESAATSMTRGVGYIVRGPELIPTPSQLMNIYEAPFVGEPNNGNIDVTGNIADRLYLLGNPYPSAINADKFLKVNAGILNGTLYFWSHKTAIGIGVSNPGSGTYAYSADDYAVYNATGGVGAAPPDINPKTNLPYTNGNPKPNGYISAGQGFFASTQVSPSGSSIVFNNTMRVAGGTILPDGTKINQQFFKTKNPNTKTAATIEKNRIWLNLTNTQGAFKQTLIGYVTDATNDYDSIFDGESFDGNEFVDFYSINQDKNLVIQGRALPFDENDEVPLGFRSTIEGSFTINIDQVDGSLANQSVFIEDKLTNTVFDLKGGNYTFNT